MPIADCVVLIDDNRFSVNIIDFILLCMFLFDWHDKATGYLYLIGAVIVSLILLYLSDKIKCIACHHKHDHI
ncbi:hypothetical protein [Arsenophonus sp. PmNCSU2021_1]|uniref:hypothetical protein n=1 Tax=Arsenophonus sp. PmNCSU2021_1 TaxID=3118989 RepID=UPI002FEED4DA